MTWHPRSEWTTETPRSSNGAPRPLIGCVDTLTVHHTGSGHAGQYLDLGDTIAELRAIQAAAVRAGKGWEYNDVGDSACDVWEYAGDHQAAHSAGENYIARGYLLLGRFDVERPPQGMLDALRDHRRRLVEWGKLTPGHVVVRHCDMPGASTSCPCLTAEEFDYISAPLEPESKDDMKLVKLYRPKSFANIFLMPTGLHIDGDTADAYLDDGCQLIDASVDHWQTIDGLLHVNGLDRGALVPK